VHKQPDHSLRAKRAWKWSGEMTVAITVCYLGFEFSFPVVGLLQLSVWVDDVRFAPNSGHKWLGRGMSAFDPKRTYSLM